MTIAITRHESGAGDLRREAARCRDARAARRMLALALVLEGSSREEAARAAGMDRQTLGGFKWSSQHLDGGVRDGHAEAAFGSVGARRVALAGPARGGAA